MGVPVPGPSSLEVGLGCRPCLKSIGLKYLDRTVVVRGGVCLVNGSCFTQNTSYRTTRVLVTTPSAFELKHPLIRSLPKSGVHEP